MTVLLKTSLSSPLRIAEISVSPLDARLGLTLCPGKKDRSQGWDRDLATDVRAIRNWGATTVLTLIEEHEFRLLAIEALARSLMSMTISVRSEVGKNCCSTKRMPSTEAVKMATVMPMVSHLWRMLHCSTR